LTFIKQILVTLLLKKNRIYRFRFSNLVRKIFFLLLFCNYSFVGFAAETEDIATLRALAKSTKDSVKLIRVLSTLGWELGFEDLSEGLAITEEAYRLAVKYKDLPMQAQTLDAIGTFYHDMGDAERAVDYHNKSISLYKSFPKEVEGLGNAYLNIARVFNSTGDYKKTQEYNFMALRLFKSASYYRGLPKLYNNIGLAFSLMGDYDSAIYYNNKSLWLNSVAKDSVNIGRLYAQMGYLYHKKNQENKANDFLAKGIGILERNKNSFQLISAYAAEGDVRRELGQIDEAIEAYRKSLQYALELRIGPDLKENYYELYKLYEKKEDVEQAFYYYKKYVQYKDDVMSEQNLNQIRLAEAAFENKTKQKEIERLQLETRNKELETDKQKWLRNAFVIMLLLAIASVVILTKQNQERRKNNAILEEKNSRISEQNKDITDSINYAQKIQQAILPSEMAMNKLFPKSFIFFQPRNVVSGDFYWASAQGSKSILAAVDCTGHGIPGAFMSMIGYSLLNQIVNEQGITSPDAILFRLREEVIKALKQTGADGESRDGMDISLLTLESNSNANTFVLEFAGANNPLVHVRNGKFTEYKGDKQPIGIYEGTPQPFTNHSLSLEIGDSVYLYTDGFADQFGGYQNKKYKYAQLKELLATIAVLPMAQQRDKLKVNFDAWKADYEQVDDVLVIGIKI
jgi:serine phosphatase RsbU (regulator of sigma subunit)